MVNGPPAVVANVGGVTKVVVHQAPRLLVNPGQPDG